MSIVAEVSMGRHDDVLETLMRAVQNRMARLQGMRFYEGASVRTNVSTRPAYMRGLTGTIVKMNQESARVLFDQEPPTGPGGRRYGREARIPLSLLELVEASAEVVTAA